MSVMEYVTETWDLDDASKYVTSGYSCFQGRISTRNSIGGRCCSKCYPSPLHSIFHSFLFRLYINLDNEVYIEIGPSIFMVHRSQEFPSSLKALNGSKAIQTKLSHLNLLPKLQFHTLNAYQTLQRR